MKYALSAIISKKAEIVWGKKRKKKKKLHEYGKLMHNLIFLPPYEYFQSEFHLISDVYSDMIYHGCCILPYIVDWIRRSLIFSARNPFTVVEPT